MLSKRQTITMCLLFSFICGCVPPGLLIMVMAAFEIASGTPSWYTWEIVGLFGVGVLGSFIASYLLTRAMQKKALKDLGL